MVLSPYYYRGLIVVAVLLVIPINFRVFYQVSRNGGDDRLLEPFSLEDFKKGKIKSASTQTRPDVGDDVSKSVDFEATVKQDETAKLRLEKRKPEKSESTREKGVTPQVVKATAADSTRIMAKAEARENEFARIDDPDTFAACLQIMDDNHFLIEWLAYHYHVLPLRRLVVFADPHSRTSPEPILNRWRDRIHITLWHEKDVYPNGIPPPPNPKKNTTKLGEHRARQRRFIRNCLQRLHIEGRAWVVLTDTDEYTMANLRIKDPMDPLSPMNYTGKQFDLPSQLDSGSVMKVLKMQDVQIPHTGQHVYNNPCITMARKNFGTKAAQNDDVTIVGYQAYNFQTIHWRYYDKTFKPGKALVNLKELRFEDISSHPSVHRPIVDHDICKGKLTVPEHQSVFVTHHYPGNLKQMLFRVYDARGDATNATAYRIDRFNQYKKFSDLYESETIQLWLIGFVHSVGLDEAKHLLEFVGLPKEAAYLDVEPNNGSEMAVSENVDDDGVLETKPSIASRNDPDSFSACLQVMDDNHFLIEWIAYHYHVLPLRRLIVLTDPNALTTPKPILDRWKDRMNITLWHEKDIFPNGIPPPPNRKKNVTKLGQHRARQRAFISQCQQTLLREKRTWAVLTDTDEYTEINSILRDPDMLAWNSDNIALPSQKEPGSVMKLLKQKNMRDLKTHKYVHEMPCLTMARRTFSTKTSNDSKPGDVLRFKCSQFQTFYWRYYDSLFKPGKAMVDLSKIRSKDIPTRPSVHRPITNETICAGKLSVKEIHSVFVVNHYPGTLKQMLFRALDARGDASNATEYRIQRFNEFKKFGKVLSTATIMEWLPGFFESVGEEEATRLLKDVGLPEQAATYISSPRSDIEKY